MSMVVRATRPGGPEVLEIGSENPAGPGAGEVLIRQTAIGLNFIDTYFRAGVYPFPAEGALVLGGEAAGEVVEVGAGVTGLRPGDRVAYVSRNGAYRATRAMPAERVVKLPDGVSDEAAAAMLKGMTAHYLIHHCHAVQAGEFVLVHAAAGGVGLILGQWLRAKGAVAIGTTSPAKADLARAHGYAHVIPYEGFVERVADITGGALCPVVYDSVGRDTYPGSLKCLRRRGMFVSFGQSSGLIDDFKLGDLAAQGSLFATRPTLFDFIATPGELSETAGALFDRIADGTLSINVGTRLGLAEAAEAHRRLEARETTGSTVLIP
jgi:NADPH2:quinone reductase